MAEMTPKEESLLKDLKGRFLRDLKAHKEWVEAKRPWSEFYDGEQWTSEELQVLKERNQPPVTINRIKPKIDSIIGMEVGLKVNTRAFDRGAQDFETAKAISESMRYVEQQNDFDNIESEAFSDQIIDGRGWYKVSTVWDGLDADPKIEKIDNEDVIKDRDGKKTDLSDSKQIHETIWSSVEDAKELFPEHKEQFDKAMYWEDVPSIDGEKHERVRPDQYDSGRDSSDSDFVEFVDKKLNRLRLVTTYYRTPYKRSFISGKGIAVQEVTGMKPSEVKKILNTFEGSVKWDQLGYRLHCATYCWNMLLESQEDIKPYDKEGKFNHVWVRGYASRNKKDCHIDYGLVRQMMDPQKEINKRRSKALHIISTNQTVMEEGAVDDVEKFRQEAARPDGIMVLRPGNAGRIQRETRTDLSASHFQLYQESKAEIDAVGIRGEVEGVSKATSGRDFQLRQQQATQSMRQLFSNLRGARRRVFMLVLDIIQQHWTAEKLIRITDDPESGLIVLNKKVTDPVTGEVYTQNDVSLGKYDLIIEEAPETVTLQGETFDILAGLAEKGYPIPMDMLIESSPIPNKKKLLERMQQQAQAQAAQAAGMPAA